MFHINTEDVKYIFRSNISRCGAVSKLLQYLPKQLVKYPDWYRKNLSALFAAMNWQKRLNLSLDFE